MRESRRRPFDEWAEIWQPGDIRVPKMRFKGVTGLVDDLGASIPRQYLSKGVQNSLQYVSDDIGDAFSSSMGSWGRSVQFPIRNLMAQHHINRSNARDVYRSIKKEGFDPHTPIHVVADDDTYGVVMNGHHRSIAARATGMTHVPAVIIPFDRVARELPDDYNY